MFHGRLDPVLGRLQAIVSVAVFYGCVGRAGTTTQLSLSSAVSALFVIPPTASVAAISLLAAAAFYLSTAASALDGRIASHGLCALSILYIHLACPMFARFPLQRGRAFHFPAGQSFRNAVKHGRKQQPPRTKSGGQQTQLGGRLISEVSAIIGHRRAGGAVRACHPDCLSESIAGAVAKYF